MGRVRAPRWPRLIPVAVLVTGLTAPPARGLTASSGQGNRRLGAGRRRGRRARARRERAESFPENPDPTV